MKTIGMLILTLVGLQATAAQGNASGELDVVAFEDAIKEMREAAGAPGMAVAVMRNGRVLHAGGYGVVGPDGEPVTPQTAFQIGSITKSFVALVILQMAAEGKLGLDDPVVRHLPEFVTANRLLSDRITIDHLVTHHSGLTTVDGNTSNEVDPDLSGPAASVAGLAQAVLFDEPGASFQYSNANYIVLSHLIEMLDGKPFEQALKARIFDPLEMSRTFVQVPPEDGIAVATGYRLWFGVPLPRQAEPTAERDRRRIGAGGVSASIEDLAIYAAAVASRDSRVVPRDAERLFAVRPMVEGWGYAYGWYSHEVDDEPVYEHSGFTPGFFSLATVVPATGHVVVVLTNMSGLAHGDLPRAVTHAAMGWDPVPAAASMGARIAIWSAVTAPLGLLLLLYKTGRRLLVHADPMSPLVRSLNAGAVLGLLIGVYVVYIGFPAMTGVSFSTGWSFFPDLTVTAVVSMGLCLFVAAGRLILVIRGA